MRQLLVLSLAVALCGPAAFGTGMTLSVESGGLNEVTVGPGAAVPYAVIGELTDDVNEGLALIGFDLSFSGGDLGPAGEPSTGNMANFVAPDGINNPVGPCPPACGYAGTIIGGDLIQIGGGQNTINNTADNAQFPIGSVITGVAWPAAPETLVTGELTAPMDEGVYTLTLLNPFANVIMDGETGEPPQDFWKTEKIEEADFTVTQLIITVGSVCTIESSVPSNCAVDARQPHDLNDAGIVFGWDSIELTLNCPTAGMSEADFAVSAGTISNVTTDGMTATLELAAPISPGAWTCFWLTDDDTNQICLGYLPGDADGDLTTAPADILAVIDHLNGVTPRPDYAVDMDRDGTTAPADILRVIDLLNGAGQFASWNGVSLDACPSE